MQQVLQVHTISLLGLRTLQLGAIQRTVELIDHQEVIKVSESSVVDLCHISQVNEMMKESKIINLTKSNIKMVWYIAFLNLYK